MSLSSTSCAFQRPSIVVFVCKIYNGFSNRIVAIKMSPAYATPGFWYGYYISPVAFGPNLDRV